MKECVIFGGLLLDKYIEVEQWPQRGLDGYIKDEYTMAGGCAINMAVAFQNLGGVAHVVSYVGHDETGGMILSYMKEHGLSTQCVLEGDLNTGYCFVFSEKNAERTFLTKKGEESHFSKDLLKKIDFNLVKHIAVTGYYLLDEDASLIMQALEECSQKGCHILFDPSPLVKDIPPTICKRMIHISQIITPNRMEAEALGQDPVAWANEMRKQNKIVVLKDGEKGGTVYSPEEVFSYKAQQVEAVDTTGAGDSFAAAFLYGFAQEKCLRDCIELAKLCAARTVQVKGPHGFWQIEDER